MTAKSLEPGALAAIDEIEQAVELVLEEAGIPAPLLSAGVFSLAGADWPKDFQLLGEAMRSRGYGQNIQIVNDAIGALRAGSPDGIGVAVACGTGAAIGARGSNGKMWHSSFWQQTQGAEELSLKALRAVYRAELGIDPPTILTRRVLTAFAASSVEEVLHLLTMRDRPRLETRRQLVHPMFDAADAGDAAARQIVVSQGEALGDYVIVAARKVGLLETPFTLVLTGGVLRHPSPLLRKALVGRVQEVCPSVRAIQSRFEPAAGAVFLALDLGCIETGASLMERLAATLPGASFFAT